ASPLLRVSARSVDVRHFGAVRTKVAGELSPVVNAVVTRESDPHGSRLLHHPEEVQLLGELFAGKLTQPAKAGGDPVLVEGDHVAHFLKPGFRLAGRFRI